MPVSAIKEASKYLPQSTPAPVRKLLGDFFAHVSSEDFDVLDPAAMAKTASLHWSMSAARKGGTPSITIETLPEENGPGRTVIDIVYDDMPFLVDSIAAEIMRHRRVIRLLFHPILHAKRDAKGRLVSLSPQAGNDTIPESHMHIELQTALSRTLIPDLKASLLAVLGM